MPPYLRLERQFPTGYTLADGPNVVGWVDAGQLALHGFADAAAAAEAAAIAARLVSQWHQHRSSEEHGVTVRPLDEAHGFVCTIPHHLWRAVFLELAQRLYVATLALRPLEPELAA